MGPEQHGRSDADGVLRAGAQTDPERTETGASRPTSVRTVTSGTASELPIPGRAAAGPAPWWSRAVLGLLAALGSPSVSGSLSLLVALSALKKRSNLPFLLNFKKLLRVCYNKLDITEMHKIKNEVPLLPQPLVQPQQAGKYC